jgi:hypothetical protein
MARHWTEEERWPYFVGQFCGKVKLLFCVECYAAFL